MVGARASGSSSTWSRVVTIAAIVLITCAGLVVPDMALRQDVHAAGTYDNASIADLALRYAPGGDRAFARPGHASAWGGNACIDAGRSGATGNSPGGAWGDGQCKAFVNCIIWMASGRTQWAGGGYFTSFASLGSEIFDVAQLTKGDIVQKYVSGTNLHTLIVISRLSGNIFNVVDSNYSGGNELVSAHPYSINLSSTVRAFRLGSVNQSPAAVDGYGPNTVSLARNRDGRLELFGVNTHQPSGQNNVYHAWQLTPGGGWSGWAILPGQLTSVAVEANADGRLEVFGSNARQPDGQNNVYHAWQLTPGGGWSGWAILPGYLTGVSLARNRDGRLELFGVNTHQPSGQNNVYHAWQLTPGGGWSGWAILPGQLTSVAVEANADGRLEVFGSNARQPDGQNNVYHAAADSGWRVVGLGNHNQNNYPVAADSGWWVVGLGDPGGGARGGGGWAAPPPPPPCFPRGAAPGGGWSGWAILPGYLG